MLTPNNRTRLKLKNPAVIADCWISSTDYPNLVALAADATYGAFVNKFIIQACAQINKMTNRYWNIQTADQIFMFSPQGFNQYQTYVLENRPINSITDIYLQVNETFSNVDLSYMQLFDEERTVRIYPLNIALSNLQVISDRLISQTTNMWFRYSSGLATADVPEDIKQATAMYVNYIVNGFKDTALVASFSTQTYSQTNSKPGDNPLLLQIKDMLKPYTLISIA